MTICPCCSNKMLRHIRHGHLYWFCRDCWLELPLMLKGWPEGTYSSPAPLTVWNPGVEWVGVP